MLKEKVSKMKVIYKRETYYIQWPKQFNKIIIQAAKKYKRLNKTISWKDAEADGALKGLIKNLTLRDISHRYSFLKQYEKNKKRRKKLRECEKTKQLLDPKKLILFKSVIPDKTKRKFGWKSKNVWTKKQKKILDELVEIYRKSKKTIDWIKLTKDKRVEKLPYQNSFKLCKYWNSCKFKKKPAYIKKHRANALKYKHDNYSKYRQNQDKNSKVIKQSVNTFLLNELIKTVGVR